MNAELKARLRRLPATRMGRIDRIEDRLRARRAAGGDFDRLTQIAHWQNTMHAASARCMAIAPYG